MISLPEETALILRDYERDLLGDMDLRDILSGITQRLGARNGPDVHAVKFRKLVTHFDLVGSSAVESGLVDSKQIEHLSFELLGLKPIVFEVVFKA